MDSGAEAKKRRFRKNNREKDMRNNYIFDGIEQTI